MSFLCSGAWCCVWFCFFSFLHSVSVRCVTHPCAVRLIGTKETVSLTLMKEKACTLGCKGLRHGEQLHMLLPTQFFQGVTGVGLGQFSFKAEALMRHPVTIRTSPQKYTHCLSWDTKSFQGMACTGRDSMTSLMALLSLGEP